MNRRGFLTGLIATAVAAPAIVRAASIMPVKRIDLYSWDYYEPPYGRGLMLEIARIEREIQDIYYKSLFEMIAQQNEILKDMPYVSSSRIPYRTGLHLGRRARDRAGRFVNAGEADRLGGAACGPDAVGRDRPDDLSGAAHDLLRGPGRRTRDVCWLRTDLAEGG